LMIEHCLKPNPNAEKWKEVKDSLLPVRPEVGDMSDQFVGRAWREAKEKFKSTKSPDKSLEDQSSPLTKPLEVTEVVPEGLTGALSVTSKSPQGLTPPSSPLQVNFYVGKDGSGGTTGQHEDTTKVLPPPNSGTQVTNKALAEQAKALRTLAKRTNKVCKTMIEKGITYFGLLPAVEMVVGKNGRGLIERVAALIIDLQRTNLPGSLICVRLSSDYGIDFSDLVVAFGRLVNDSGEMPRGWEKLKLPMNLTEPPKEG